MTFSALAHAAEPVSVVAAVPQPGSAAPSELPRSWVLREVLAVELNPPIRGGWIRSETVATWAVDWAVGEPSMTTTLCSLVSAPVMGVTTSWREGFAERIAPRRRAVSFDGTRFEVPLFADSMGATDDDADGNPGVTVTVAIPIIGKGDLYVTQDATLALVGELRADGRIAGTSTWHQDQRVLGATRWWLEKPLGQRDAAEPGTFELTPVATPGCP